MRPVALCDIRPEKAAALARQMGCEGLPVYTDYQTMLDETRPELVAVATPSHSHAAIGWRCSDEAWRSLWKTHGAQLAGRPAAL